MYFKDKSSEIIFYLVETDGKTRQEGLDVTEIHYYSKPVAELWKNNLLNVMNKDHPMYEKAKKKLNQLYENMIDY